MSATLLNDKWVEIDFDDEQVILAQCTDQKTGALLLYFPETGDKIWFPRSQLDRITYVEDWGLYDSGDKTAIQTTVSEIDRSDNGIYILQLEITRWMANKSMPRRFAGKRKGVTNSKSRAKSN